MGLQFLSQTNCKELVKLTPQLNQNNLFSFCVIDCAIVKGKLVVYEFQSPLNSAIGKKSFLKLIDWADQTIFIDSMSRGSAGIVGEGKINYYLAKFGNEKNFTVKAFADLDEKIDFEADDKNKLVIFDGQNRSFNAVDYSDISQILYFKYYQAQKRLHWISADANFGPSESLFFSKHLQRLALSNSEFTPPFMFIEKKKNYTDEDISNILDFFNLKGDFEQVAIKADLGTYGRGNNFVNAIDLKEYLNSKKFHLQYKNDDVILIEKVSNEKINEYYHTQRYAASSLNGNHQTFLKIYEEKHLKISSHTNHNWNNWFSEDHNEMEDKEIQQQLKEALTNIQTLDYAKLIEKLLTSNNNVAILIGLQMMLYNYPVLFIDYDLHKEKNKISAKSVTLKISNTLLETLASFMKSDNERIKERTNNLLKNIINYLNFNKWKNATDAKVMQQLSDIRFEYKKTRVSNKVGFWAHDPPVQTKLNIDTSSKLIFS